MKLPLAPLTERAPNRMALPVTELAYANELIDRMLDQALQVAGSQVEQDLAVVKTLLQPHLNRSNRGSSISEPM
jgi:hypothetical protein